MNHGTIPGIDLTASQKILRLQQPGVHTSLTSMMNEFLAGLALGIVASGLGAGGGIIAVPVVLTLFDAPLAQATAGALLVVWAGSVFGALRHALGARVRWKAVALMGLPSVAGAALGAQLHPLVPAPVTMALFSFVLLSAALFMVLHRSGEELPQLPHPRPLLLMALGMWLGVMTGFLGVGGGFLMVPALAGLVRLPLRVAIGTSVAIVAGTSFSGAVSHVAAGAAPLHLILPMGAGAMVGSFFGAPLSARVPDRALRLGLAVLALAAALGMGAKAYRAWGAAKAPAAPAAATAPSSIQPFSH